MTLNRFTLTPPLTRVPKGAIVTNYALCKLCEEPFLREDGGTDLGFCGRLPCYLFRLHAARSHHSIGNRRCESRRSAAAGNRSSQLPIYNKRRKRGHRAIGRNGGRGDVA